VDQGRRQKVGHKRINEVLSANGFPPGKLLIVPEAAPPAKAKVPYDPFAVGSLPY